MSTRRRDRASEEEPAQSDGGRTGAEPEKTNQPTPLGWSLHVQFIFVCCWVCDQCFWFQSYSNHFLFCSLWLMYLSCILYQIVAGFGPIRWYGRQDI
ncbi:hypothetical protein T07_12948 [Trichinella nelsoni]|uniref:Uncharacterized protein n=1 Tax=Trichinella nelsoni TaxID=6336 RepID=A0A0V0SD91_9BILA|nr:hypothetical protein T07_12948 [Trichinella nelsoni]